MVQYTQCCSGLNFLITRCTAWLAPNHLLMLGAGFQTHLHLPTQTLRVESLYNPMCMGLVRNQEQPHLKHAVVEDRCLPAPLCVFVVVSQSPDVPATTVALQIEQHYGLHIAWDGDRLPVPIQTLHLNSKQALSNTKCRHSR